MTKVNRQRIVEGLAAYSARQSELGRDFARHMGMHVTDSAAVVEILRAEGRGEPLTPARLAERVGLTSGATSILVNRLEDAGHVSRRRGHADRRRVTLHTATSVHGAADEFFTPVRHRMGELMGRYSDEELAVVARFVADLRATAEDGPPGAEQPGHDR